MLLASFSFLAKYEYDIISPYIATLIINIRTDIFMCLYKKNSIYILINTQKYKLIKCKNKKNCFPQIRENFSGMTGKLIINYTNLNVIISACIINIQLSISRVWFYEIDQMYGKNLLFNLNYIFRLVIYINNLYV